MPADHVTPPLVGLRFNQVSDFYVRIHSCQHHDYQGELTHPYSDSRIQFLGIIHLLDQIWEILAAYNYPRATNHPRQWTREAHPYHEEDIMKQKNATETQAQIGGPSFLIKVHYRQNASWQGTIQWLDTRQTMPFRSALELIRLMDNVVRQALPITEESSIAEPTDEDGYSS